MVERIRNIQSIDNFSLDDRGWSEWQSFSDCKGIPCTMGRQRRIRTCLNPPTITNRPSCDGEAMQERECSVACLKDEKMSFSEWTNCIGLPCQMGQQTRQRQCSPSSACGNELIEERNCFIPCSNQTQSNSTIDSPQTVFETDGIYSNWTNWSACRSSDCTSIRTRQCLRGPCQDDLIENRPCQNDFCSSNYHERFKERRNSFRSLDITHTRTLVSSSVFHVIGYSSAGIGALIFLLLAILFVIIYCRRQRYRRAKKGTN